MDTSPVVRVNVTLPQSVVLKVKNRTKRGGMSKFLLEAAEEKLAREEREQALKDLIEDPTTVMTGITDTVTYVRALRTTDNQRDKRLGI